MRLSCTITRSGRPSPVTSGRAAAGSGVGAAVAGTAAGTGLSRAASTAESAANLRRRIWTAPFGVSAVDHDLVEAGQRWLVDDDPAGWCGPGRRVSDGERTTVGGQLEVQ